MKEIVIGKKQRQKIENALRSMKIKFEYSPAFRQYWLTKGKQKSEGISAYELYDRLILKDEGKK